MSWDDERARRRHWCDDELCSYFEQTWLTITNCSWKKPLYLIEEKPLLSQICQKQQKDTISFRFEFESLLNPFCIAQGIQIHMIAYTCSSLCIYCCVCWITGSLIPTFTLPESIIQVLPQQLPQQAVGDFGFFLVKLKNKRSLWRQYSPVVLQLWAYVHNYAAQIDEGQACEYFREILIYTSARTLSSEDEKPRKILQ